MKKHPQADALAARLADAANKPLGIVQFPVPQPPAETATEEAVETQPESPAIPATPAEQSKPRKPRRKKAGVQAAEEPEDDTVPISLRPRRDLHRRYVLAAAERTRETGRVISAQQIMLEVLDGGP